MEFLALIGIVIFWSWWFEIAVPWIADIGHRNDDKD